MVGRCAPLFDSELYARPGTELVGMEAQAQPGGPAGGEHRPALVGVEGAHLAEGVDPAGVRRGRVEHRAAHEVHIVVGAPLVLGRNHMGTEEGGLGGEPFGNLQAPHLVASVQSVARLDLHCGDARAASLLASCCGEPGELVVARPTGCVDRHEDATGLVGCAGHTGGELVTAVAGENEVGVAVHEAGDHATSSGVDAPVGNLSRRADRDDPVAGHHHRCVSHQTQRTLPKGWFVGDQQADVVDDSGERTHVASIRSPIAAASSAETSMDLCRPPATTTSPPTTTWCTSAALAAKTTVSSTVAGE